MCQIVPKTTAEADSAGLLGRNDVRDSPDGEKGPGSGTLLGIVINSPFRHFFTHFLPFFFPESLWWARRPIRRPTHRGNFPGGRYFVQS